MNGMRAAYLDRFVQILQNISGDSFSVSNILDNNPSQVVCCCTLQCIYILQHVLSELFVESLVYCESCSLMSLLHKGKNLFNFHCFRHDSIIGKSQSPSCCN